MNDGQGPGKRPPRIVDVAEAAGVSTATVSRTLSRPETVTATTRNAVLAAVERIGYTVNHAASNLRRQRSGGIVALVPNLANPFFSEILGGIAEVLSPAGYNLLIADTRGGSNPLDYADRRRADGLIALDGAIPPDALARGGRGGSPPPTVLACEWIEGLQAPRVRIDNAAAAELAIAHLAELGHRRIGHVQGPPSNVLTQTRQIGVEQALSACGLEVRGDWFLPGDFSYASGQRAARAWLEMTDRPTALFCASDAMACGLMGELQRRGVKLPDDLSVVGFDGIELAAHLAPTLATIRQPRREIGRTAARALLDLLTSEATPPPSDQILPVEFLGGGSAGPA